MAMTTDSFTRADKTPLRGPWIDATRPEGEESGLLVIDNDVSQVIVVDDVGFVVEVALWPS